MKSFLYLDEYKMYSISSQLFEGLTDYILQSKSDDVKETSEQKGKLGSGRVMADILTTRHSQTERRFLHDYAYTLFEKKLTEDNHVLVVDSTTLHDVLPSIHGSSFVKVTGRAVFNDTKMVHEMVVSHRQILRALRYVTIGGELEKAAAELNEQAKKIPDRNKRAGHKNLIKSKLQQLRKADDELSDEYVQNLEYVIKELYQNQLLFQIFLDDESDVSMFSASLNRDNLKEDIIHLLHKFGRQTEREFTMFGIVTQSGKVTNDALSFVEAKMAGEQPGMRMAILNIINMMNGMDKTVTGRLEHEYIIDPIALYYQL